MGFFDVDVLTGFAGLDGHIGVPMVGCCNADSVNIIRGDQVTEVRVDSRVGDHLQGRFDVRLIDL